MSETDPQRRNEEPQPHALHGYRNEVNWEGGSGRQPYTNQRGGVPSPGAGEEVAEGNRGARSGVAQDHLERAKRKP